MSNGVSKTATLFQRVPHISMADLALAVRAEKTEEVDLALFTAALRSAGVQDEILFQVLGAGDRLEIARLLSDPTREGYGLLIQPLLGNLFAPSAEVRARVKRRLRKPPTLSTAVFLEAGGFSPPAALAPPPLKAQRGEVSLGNLDYFYLRLKDFIGRPLEEMVQRIASLGFPDRTHVWHLRDAAALVIDALNRHLGVEKTSVALGYIALAAVGWNRASQKGEKARDDVLMKELKQLGRPGPFADALRALAMGFENPRLAPPLKAFLNREAANLHALQYLLTAFYLAKVLNRPDRFMIELLEAEREMHETYNRHGKVRNNKFLKHLLTDRLARYLEPNRFALESEMIALIGFAEDEAISMVEIVPETWLEGSADFRVHRPDGSRFLVEVKALHYRGEDWEGFVEAVRFHIGKALWQLKEQHQSDGDRPQGDQIIVYLRAQSGEPLSADQMETLQRAAEDILSQRRIATVKIRIEQ